MSPAFAPEGPTPSAASEEPLDTIHATWHVVCAHDGTVLMATGLLPASAIGAQIDDCADAPEDLKDVVSAALEHSRIRPGAPASLIAELSSAAGTVSVTIVPAMALRCQPTDLPALLRSTLEGAARHARSGDIRVVLQVEKQFPPQVYLDGEKIAWVVNALVEHALQYVRGGSMLMPSGSIYVRVIYNEVNGQVVIEVQDDGPGIPAEKLRALFDKTPHGGRIAQGLPLIREIVAAHGGSLEVDSQADSFMGGAIMRIMLPVG